MRKEDTKRVHEYIGGIIKGVGGLPIEIGGMTDHVHILTSLPKTMSKEEVEKVVMSDEQTAKYLAGNAPKKVIVVPGRIVNIVV